MTTPAHYLVIAPQGLGDTLEATPLLRALRHHDAAARIDVVVTRPGPRLLFEGLAESAGDVIYLPYWEHGLAAFARSLAGARRNRRYEASFLAYPSARRAYEVLLMAFPARRRYAHRHNGVMLLDAPGTRTELVDIRKAHNVERNRDLLRAAGIVPDEEPGYLVPGDWIDAAGRSPRRVAIHVGSIKHDGLAARRWPIERFSALCAKLVADGLELVAIAGPDEREETAQLQREVPSVGAFEGSLPEVARFLSTCALTVANDNGIAHLACGVGTPVIALFGPTPVEHGPFSPSATALRPSQCPPCFDVRNPVVRCVRNINFACLDELTVDIVYETVTGKLASATGR